MDQDISDRGDCWRVKRIDGQAKVFLIRRTLLESTCQGQCRQWQRGGRRQARPRRQERSSGWTCPSVFEIAFSWTCPLRSLELLELWSWGRSQGWKRRWPEVLGRQKPRKGDVWDRWKHLKITIHRCGSLYMLFVSFASKYKRIDLLPPEQQWCRSACSLSVQPEHQDYCRCWTSPPVSKYFIS